MNRLKKGDQVYIISGKDKGKLGTVSKIINEEKILVDGINLAKKHVKPNPNKNETGGIVEKEMPIHISISKKHKRCWYCNSRLFRSTIIAFI